MVRTALGSRTALILAGLVSVGLLPAHAKDMDLKVVDKDCWVEIFEDNDFDKDDPHVKIQGPTQVATLSDFSGRNWNNEIQSIIVGPSAEIRAYPDTNFEGTEVVMKPNRRVNDLEKLNMSDDIESLKITCGRG
ncbi:MAG: hypothetical protein CV090_12120 [Nitrospira sp. WS238]|nr:hypothetical protein [Nitrospira sp. WS238]